MHINQKKNQVYNGYKKKEKENFSLALNKSTLKNVPFLSKKLYVVVIADRYCFCHHQNMILHFIFIVRMREKILILFSLSFSHTNIRLLPGLFF